jgi:single-strand DNA-binding protein
MNDMNSFTASGRATGNAELTEIATSAGSKFGKLSFSIATNSSYKNAKGETIPQVEFHNCIKTYNLLDNGYLPKHAYDMRDMILQGRKVLIRGKVTTRSFKSDQYPELKQFRTEIDLNGYESHVEVSLPPRVATNGQPVASGGQTVTGHPYNDAQPQVAQQPVAQPQVAQQAQAEPVTQEWEEEKPF